MSIWTSYEWGSGGSTDYTVLFNTRNLSNTYFHRVKNVSIDKHLIILHYNLYERLLIFGYNKDDFVYIRDKLSGRH